MTDISDDWSKLGSISQDEWVSYEGINYGYIEHFTEVYINNSESQSSTEDYAVTQRGWMNPANDHSWGNNAVNHKTHQSQNWNRSDLGSVDHLDHSPRRDEKASFNGEITAGYASGSVTMSVDIPYIQRNVEYETERQAQTYYQYPQNVYGHEAKYVDCNQEQIGIWRAGYADDNDTITSSYYWGRFAEPAGTAVSDNVVAFLTKNIL